MTPPNLIMCEADDCLAEAVRKMDAFDVDVVLLTHNGCFKGIVTERDLSRAICHGCHPQETRLEQIDRSDMLTACSGQDLLEPTETISGQEIWLLPISSNGSPSQTVPSDNDLLKNVLNATVVRICHEVNNPATVILGVAELLLISPDSHLDETVRKSLHLIIEQASRIGHAVRRISDLEEFVVSDSAGIPMIELPQES